MFSLTPLIGSHDLVLITLDTLRLDVAEDSMNKGMTPAIDDRIQGKWEQRHSPASFTFAAHQAFFAGYLPTPAQPGQHPRLYASSFLGSETITEETFCFEEPELVTALRRRQYHTICIGGVGFFNKQNELGRVLPNLFDESHWSQNTSVTDRDSTEHQVGLAIDRVRAAGDQRVFLFLNISALHQPNYFYLPGAKVDCADSQAAALAYVDKHLGRLWGYLEQRNPGVCIICSDHGTAYGEDGFTGHRIGHEVVWNVPYAHFKY